MKTKVTIYKNKVNSISGELIKKIIFEESRPTIMRKINAMPIVKQYGKLKYDGRMGIYTIYKSEVKNRHFLCVHLENVR